MRYLVLVFMAACAGPSGRVVYERGTYSAAPPLRPGHGAPVVGQPGQVRPGIVIEPGPVHTRVLPSTPEPGLWSGDRTYDTAASITELDEGELLLLPIPVPPKPEPQETGYATLCSVGAGRFITLAAGMSYADTKARIDSWGVRDANCVAARVFYACTILFYKDAEIRKLPPKAKASLKRVMEAGSKFVDQNCTGVILEGDAETIRSRATVQLGNWYRVYRKGVVSE